MDDVKKRRQSYTTLSRRAEIEFTEKRSRFIGIALPIKDGEEAEQALRGFRELYPDATHVVSAWQHVLPLVGGKYSDDGEPQGTAGLPVLDVLRKRGVDQAAIYVVRYFGGVKLGAGGLVRAYSTAASEALEKAGPVTLSLHEICRVTAPYEIQETLRYALMRASFRQGEPEFGMDVEWRVAVLPERLEEFASLCAEVSAGAVLIEEEGIDYAPSL